MKKFGIAAIKKQKNISEEVDNYKKIINNSSKIKLKKIIVKNDLSKKKKKSIIVKESSELLNNIFNLFDQLSDMDIDTKIHHINTIRKELHKYSPFLSEPVDCVVWKPFDSVTANDYNPNAVAPPEMELLQRSILEDGYTQPIVSWENDGVYEVVDGYHRNRVGKESDIIRNRIYGYLPLSVINEDRKDKSDRIASTIRHNRARGKHQVDAMSDIILELKNRNWTNERIAKNLGMDQDEILRLCQITGLAGLFSDQEFSKSWDVEDSELEDSEKDYAPLSDDDPVYDEEMENFRAANTSDSNRIFHTWDKWECYESGFYATTKEGMNRKECERAFADFFLEGNKFAITLKYIIKEWKHSCEHYLTNVAMNRIAWLGQASVSHALGIPAVYRGGWFLLSEEDQDKANRVALIYLNRWLKSNGMKKLTLEEGLAGRQVDLY